MKAEHPRFERVIATLLLLSLFVYLLLRAWYVVPMHDEIATFFHYIETGKIFEMGMVFDANNHFLNSYLGRLLYLVGLDHYFFYRLGNVLAFVLYFYGIRAVLRPVSGTVSRLILLAACTSVPFILEYFAYSRGYGMGMAFFVWVFYYARKLAEKATLSHAFKLAFFTFFMLFSNLIFTGTYCLVFALMIFIYWKERTGFSTKQKIQFLALIGALLLTTAPLLAYSFFLKKIGALYYGSLDGLWEVSGKSLSSVVLFNNSDSLKWIILLLLLLGFIFYLSRFFRSGIWQFLKDSENMLSVFLFGNLLIIIVLALIFEVNYPEDRAGMYLIPLFILLIGFRLQTTNWSKILSFSLLFFPLSLLLHLSLSTSVFSPDVRMSEWFYNKVRRHITADKNVVVYPTMHLSWHWFERQQQEKIFPNVSAVFNPGYDVIITREDRLPKNWDQKDLKLIAHDKETGHLAFIHSVKQAKKMQLAFTKTTLDVPDSEKEWRSIPISKLWIDKTIEIKLLMQVDHLQSSKGFSVVIQLENESGKVLRKDVLEQSWYANRDGRTFRVRINNIFQKIDPDEKKMSVYLLNRSGKRVQLSDASIVIYSLEK